MRAQLWFPDLFFFGVQLEALVQGAAMLLQVLLLLIPHALRIFHHLLLDAAKQTGGQARTSGRSFRVPTPPPPLPTYTHTKDKGMLARLKWEKKAHHSFVLFSHSITSFVCGGPPEPQSFRALQRSKRGNCQIRWKSFPLRLVPSTHINPLPQKLLSVTFYAADRFPLRPRQETGR